MASRNCRTAIPNTNAAASGRDHALHTGETSYAAALTAGRVSVRKQLHGSSGVRSAEFVTGNVRLKGRQAAPAHHGVSQKVLYAHSSHFQTEIALLVSQFERKDARRARTAYLKGLHPTKMAPDCAKIPGQTMDARE